MKKFIVALVLSVVWTGQVLAQTILGGVINSYARVTNISGNQFDINNVYGNVSDFSAGRTVLVIQMKGASVRNGQNNQYGDITAYNNAGNYEFAIVSNLINLGGGNYRVVFNTVARTYDVAGAVQLVSVPSYSNLTIAGDVTAKPWSAADGTGGVVALEVQNTLTLNASIDVSGLGFRGGSPNSQPNGGSNDENTYRTNNNGYAAKGEGIALPNQPNGRGKVANAGGGGNPHNAGGGGGANLGSGGNGGRGWPGAGGTTGAGIGGVGLMYDPIVNKVFMGGGGGAGQQNNNRASRGGNGGGIIILRAGTITSTNCGAAPALRANGEDAPNSTGNDGAGGGGAGGSVLVEAGNITMPCLLTIEVSGGNGGNVNHNAAHGGGGGGGVGAFLSNKDFSAATNVIAVPGQNGRDCTT